MENQDVKGTELNLNLNLNSNLDQNLNQGFNCLLRTSSMAVCSVNTHKRLCAEVINLVGGPSNRLPWRAGIEPARVLNEWDLA